jgi:hypothetical protein
LHQAAFLREKEGRARGLWLRLERGVYRALAMVIHAAIGVIAPDWWRGR